MTERPRLPSNIYPSLTYDDAPAAIEWLCRVFGFEKRLVVPREGGGVQHSELSLGPGVVMVSSPKDGRVGTRALRGSSGGLCVRVDDPDAHYERAKKAGAEVLHPPRDESYGARGYAVLDLEGRSWYFSDYSPGAWWDAE